MLAWPWWFSSTIKILWSMRFLWIQYCTFPKNINLNYILSRNVFMQMYGDYCTEVFSYATNALLIVLSSQYAHLVQYTIRIICGYNIKHTVTSLY